MCDDKTNNYCDPNPSRFCVDYLMEAASEAEARQLARELCLEQTVELPGKIDLVKQVEAYTVGAIEQIMEVRKSALYRIGSRFLTIPLVASSLSF